MKIAVQLDDDRNIIGTVTTNEFGAQLQVKLYGDKGWILVEDVPTFSSSDSYLWTVRESDNKLVHITTGMTPDEEGVQANALLGQNVGKALVQSNTANTTAQNAIDIANQSVQANAELGKLIAPILAAQTKNDGGTN